MTNLKEEPCTTQLESDTESNHKYFVLKFNFNLLFRSKREYQLHLKAGLPNTKSTC